MHWIGIVAATTLLVSGVSPGADGGVWVENCLGQALIAGDSTRAMAMAKAKEAARLQAVEKVAGTVVSNRFIDVRIVSSGGNGAEMVLREVSAFVEGFVLDSRNERWETSEVAAGSGEPPLTRIAYRADLKVAKMPTPDASFTIDLEFSRKTVVAGETLSLVLSATEAAYLTIFNVAADNRVYLLCPNRFRPQLLLERGEEARVPGPDDAFELRPKPMEGHREDVEVIRAIATRRPVSPPKESQDGTIALSSFYRWLYALPAGEWAEAVATYKVVLPLDPGTSPH